MIPDNQLKLIETNKIYPACGSEADIPLIGVEAKRRSRYRGPACPVEFGVSRAIQPG